MTYDAMKVSDYQMLDILALARKEGALVMVHAENHDMIQWLAHHLIEQGHGTHKFHAIDHERVAQLRDALAKGELPFDAGKLAGLIQRFHRGEK